MPTATNDGLKSINASTLHAWLASGEATLVDVREPSEHAGERIAGAQLAPLSSFDPQQLSHAPSKKLVLHCYTGTRSAQAGHKMLAAGWTTVWHLEGGLQAWQQAGYDTERSAQAPISLQRQVQITAGSLVFLGTLLGAVVSPWWLLLSGFVGAGLIFAGLTNTCGMAMLLARLPYNQRAVR